MIHEHLLKIRRFFVPIPRDLCLRESEEVLSFSTNLLQRGMSGFSNGECSKIVDKTGWRRFVAHHRLPLVHLLSATLRTVARIERQAVDLSPYPGLVIIYLGMKARSLRGLATMLRLGPQINQSVAARPDGLLLHEPVLYSVFPFHFGMRQYWRDFASMEAWTRTIPHQTWWKNYLKDPGGTGFWHEVYTADGRIEAIYDNMDIRTGLGAFGDLVPARGPMFGARSRLQMTGEAPEPPLAEREL